MGMASLGLPGPSLAVVTGEGSEPLAILREARSAEIPEVLTGESEGFGDHVLSVVWTERELPRDLETKRTGALEEDLERLRVARAGAGKEPFHALGLLGRALPDLYRGSLPAVLSPILSHQGTLLSRERRFATGRASPLILGD